MISHRNREFPHLITSSLLAMLPNLIFCLKEKSRDKNETQKTPTMK